MSKKGNSLLLLKGYTYYPRPTSTANQQWRCSTHLARGCRGHLIIKDGKITREKEHNHSPNMDTTSRKSVKLQSSMKDVVTKKRSDQKYCLNVKGNLKSDSQSSRSSSSDDEDAC